ncbi:MAG: hypothetical protein Q4B42_06205, partial [Oscillospiraceae bacterium]|nr:hypothetical protein [Oscillospiraceae bacterium]
MPQEGQKTIKSELLIDAEIERVWACLCSEAGLKELFGEDSAVKLNRTESGEISGRLRLGATLFTL